MFTFRLANRQPFVFAKISSANGQTLFEFVGEGKSDFVPAVFIGDAKKSHVAQF